MILYGYPGGTCFKSRPYVYARWETIDDYLKMTRRDILKTKGRITHKQALGKVNLEYKKFKEKQNNNLKPVERHFLESIEQLDEVEKKTRNVIVLIVKRTQSYCLSRKRIGDI